MTQPNRNKRHADIAAAAYALLGEKGFGSTTMLGVAKRAKASNETMYRWYGDKVGLFRTLIEDNAAEVSALLDDALGEGAPPEATLRVLGPVLLGLLVGDRAVALNRAAAADASGVLGQAIGAAGRETVFPKVIAVFEAAVAEGVLTGAPGPIAARWLDLLVGDMQIRRAIGTLPAPSSEAIADRASAALDAILRLYGAQHSPGTA